MPYFSTNTGTGPPLLLLHGFTGCTRNWEPLVPHLAQSHTVVTVDLPGHGQTASPADLAFYRMGPLATKLITLMEGLGHATFDLLGYSMGGRLALFMAAHYPKQISRLVLESASPGLKTVEEREARTNSDNGLADRIEREGIESFVNFWESISLWESQESLSAASKTNLRSIRLSNNPAGLANSLRGMGTGQQPSLWPLLPKLNLPVLLLTGELDHKFCTIAQEMHKLLPNGLHHTIPAAGHTVHLEQPEAWSHAVSQFLKSVNSKQ